MTGCRCHILCSCIKWALIKRTVILTNGGTELKVRSKLFYSYLLFVIIYAGFVLLPAPSSATLSQYHVSAFWLRAIYVTLILILAGIWFAGFYSYAKLREYARLINDNKDGKQVSLIVRGIFLLVIWLPVSSVSSVILNHIAMRHLGWLPAVTIFDNYVSLLFPLAGFIYISLGARGLSNLVRAHSAYVARNVMAIFLIYVGLIYYHLVATTPFRTTTYHMSIWIILLTLVAPYIYMWFVGLQASYEIYHYRRKVAGIVYKNSWNLLTLGLGWLIIMSIGLQYLTTLTPHLNHLSIYWMLAIIYSLLLLLAAGFVLIALGARKLKKIEEV